MEPRNLVMLYAPAKGKAPPMLYLSVCVTDNVDSWSARTVGFTVFDRSGRRVLINNEGQFCQKPVALPPPEGHPSEYMTCVARESISSVDTQLPRDYRTIGARVKVSVRWKAHPDDNMPIQSIFWVNATIAPVVHG
jgi:hypothetical protein